MKYLSLLFSSVLIVSLTACSPGSDSAYDKGKIEADIRTTLTEQSAAWNSGDIEAFMQDYLKTDALRFASGGNVNRGWEVTLRRYQSRYPDRAAMGVLTFSDLEIEVVSAQDALVFGRWALQRDADRPNGLFTLHMKHIDGAWVIASDHTSSAPPETPTP